MFTSKQRSRLRAMASTQKPLAQVGKDGISDTLIKSLSEALEAHELIKLNILPAAGEDALEIACEICQALRAELVAVTGRKAVLYRRSKRKDVKHLEF